MENQDLIMIDNGTHIRTNHPDALRVGAELGVKAGYCNAEHTLVLVNCSKDDFYMILADLPPANPKFNKEAYEKIQSEGYGDR